MEPSQLNRIWIGAPPPQDYLNNAQTWIDCNPGMTVKEWDEESILALGLDNQPLWDLAPKIQPSRLVPRLRSDIARYEILWRFGGIYADHDYRAIKPIGPHIAGARCFAVQEKPGLIANGLMGCEPGHPFLRALIDGLDDSVRKQVRQQTWRTAGPGYVTRMAKGRGDLTVLPSRQFLPYHHTDLGKQMQLPQDAVCEHTWGSARGQVSVIIPWRDGPGRKVALGRVLERYASHRDWQIVVQEAGPGEFNKAATVNEGVRRSFGDVLVIADADLLCDGVETAVEMVRRGARWIMPYKTLHRLSQAATHRMLTGEKLTGRTDDLDGIDPYPGVIGGGIVVVARKVFEQVPMDERFVGWGGEDIAWGLALRALAGAPRHLDSSLWHLWHPSPYTHASKGSPENYALYQRYAKAARNVNLMRALVRGSRKALVQV